MGLDNIMKEAECRLQTAEQCVKQCTRLLWRHAVGIVSTWSRELQQIE